jgi:hypothetical protein
MERWRILASLVAALILAGAARAQSFSLAEAGRSDSYFRIKLSMGLTGQLKVVVDGKEKSLKELATAGHDYVERILETGSDGVVTKAARLYKEAKVAITVDDSDQERSLRKDRMFMGAQRTRDGVLTYSREGPLTRDEADVTDHFDTLAIPGLLPTKDVAIGDSWKVGNNTAQALCHLQALSAQSLTCKLQQVKDGVATFSIDGTAAGIDLGASVKTTITGTGRFDLKEHRLIALDWKQSNERDQGPVSPASAVEVAIKVTREPIEPVNELSDIAVVPLQPRADLTDLEFKDPQGRFELQCSRQWYLVGHSPEHTVFRLMDRGELVAQLTVAPWQKAADGKHLTPEEVKSVVANSPGWNQDTLIKDEEVKLMSNQWAYLVAGEGDLSSGRAVQYFYFLAAPEGNQAMLTFTMTPAQAQKLGSRDLEIVRGFLLAGATRDESRINTAPSK